MIRKAQTEDISRIAEIFVFGKRTAYRDIFKNDDFSFNELQVVPLYQLYLDNPSLLRNMTVYDDGIVKGVINTEYIENGLEICELYVEPFFRGHGVGSELLRHVLSEANAEKADKVGLWVIKDNLPARKFYERHGFHAAGETRPVEGTQKTEMRYSMCPSRVYHAGTA